MPTPQTGRYVDADGHVQQAVGFVQIGADGTDIGLMSVTLASNAALAANAGTTPVTGIRRGVYVWDAQWSGAGSLALQALATDGVTWRTIATLTAPGTFAGEIRIGANATARVFNTNAAGGAGYTALYSALS